MRIALFPACLSALALLACAGGVLAQNDPAQTRFVFDDAATAQRALAEAQLQGEAAQRRAAQLETEAASASEAAERTARETAAIAARIQQTESALASNEARLGLIAHDRAVLMGDLAARQQPVVRLTGALQRLSRRPMLLSLLRPGSLKDTVHLHALLETMLPEVERRTASLRQQIARIGALRQRENTVRQSLRSDQAELGRRRQALATLETTQRLASREANQVADREGERALALAEQARDLGALSTGLARLGALRAQLAALPGPVLRPDRPDLAEVESDTVNPAGPSEPGLSAILLPVDGRLIAGFGQARADQGVSRGIVLAPRINAQAIAPAAGRVVFAGPFRGYGTIVIMEHRGGWTSLITGLSELAVRVGDTLVAGSPLGIAAGERPAVTLELRRDGQPVNPLDLVRG